MQQTRYAREGGGGVRQTSCARSVRGSLWQRRQKGGAANFRAGEGDLKITSGRVNSA